MDPVNTCDDSFAVSKSTNRHNAYYSASQPPPLSSTLFKRSTSSGSRQAADARASPYQSPQWMPPCSPNTGSHIDSISQQMARLFQSGRARCMIHNANIQLQDNKPPDYTAPYREPSLVPRILQSPYNEPTPKPSTARSSSYSEPDLVSHVPKSPSRLIDDEVRRRKTYLALRSEMVVVGLVCNKSDDRICIQIHEVFPTSTDDHSNSSSSRRLSPFMSNLAELDIQGECDISEIGTDSTGDHLIEQFTIEDCVKALILSVDAQACQIHLSMNQHRLLTSTSAHQLGIVAKLDEAEEPTKYGFNPADRSDSYGQARSYNSLAPGRDEPVHSSDTLSNSSWIEMVKEHHLFRNPFGVKIMAKAYEVDNRGSLLHADIIEPSGMYRELLDAQNVDFAKKSVSNGRALLNLPTPAYANALKCFQHALEIAPKFIEAHLARGDVFLLTDDLENASKCFRIVLKLDAENIEAKDGLDEIERKLHPDRFSLDENLDGNVTLSPRNDRKLLKLFKSKLFQRSQKRKRSISRSSSSSPLPVEVHTPKKSKKHKSMRSKKKKRKGKKKDKKKKKHKKSKRKKRKKRRRSHSSSVSDTPTSSNSDSDRYFQDLERRHVNQSSRSPSRSKV
eukprot:238223_1